MNGECFHVWKPLLDKCGAFLCSCQIDVDEQNIGAFLSEEERRLEADATAIVLGSEMGVRCRLTSLLR